MFEIKKPPRYLYFRSFAALVFALWVRRFPVRYDVVGFFWISLLFVAIFYIEYMLDEFAYKMSLVEHVEVKPETKTMLPNLNRPVYEQVVPLVKFDIERNLAIMLCVMHDHQMPVNLTEKKWVKPNKFKTRAEFLSVLDKWKGRGVIARQADRKNSPYEVKDWDAVRLIAQGEKLR